MEDGLNISKPEVLLSIAEKLTVDEFDFDKFEEDWSSGAGKALFRKDLEKTKYHAIGRFPTLTFQNESGKGIMIVGYRPYKILEQAFEHVLQL